MSGDAAKQKLIEAGFAEEKIILAPQNDDNVPIEKVIGTVPEAGTLVSPDEIITIAVSQGPGEKMVPYLEGKTKEAAEALLENAGLAGKVTEEHNADVEAGVVISQLIEYGTYVDATEVIEYVVSLGPEPAQMVQIPTGLSGKSYSSVKATLINLGLEVTPYYAESKDFADGYVIAVAGEGEEVEKGSYVVVTVSTGISVTPEEPTEPEEPEEPTEPEKPEEPTEPVKPEEPDEQEEQKPDENEG